MSWSGGVGGGEERSDGGARCCMLPVVFATPSISLSVCVCALACAADAIAFQSPHDFLVPALTPSPFSSPPFRLPDIQPPQPGTRVGAAFIVLVSEASLRLGATNVKILVASCHVCRP